MADRARSTSSTYPQRTQPEGAEANEHTCTILPPCNTFFEHLTRPCDTTFRRSSRAQSEPRQERRQEPVRLKPTQTQTPLWVIAQAIYLGFIPGVLGRAACAPQALCSLLYSSTSSGHGDGGEGPQRALLCSTHSLLWYPGVASLFGAPLASLFAGSAPGLAVLRSLGQTRPPASPSLTDQCSGPRRGLRLSALGISARRLLRRPHRL